MMADAPVPDTGSAAEDFRLTLVPRRPRPFDSAYSSRADFAL